MQLSWLNARVKEGVPKGSGNGQYAVEPSEGSEVEPLVEPILPIAACQPVGCGDYRKLAMFRCPSSDKVCVVDVGVENVGADGCQGAGYLTRFTSILAPAATDFGDWKAFVLELIDERAGIFGLKQGEQMVVVAPRLTLGHEGAHDGFRPTGWGGSNKLCDH